MKDVFDNQSLEEMREELKLEREAFLQQRKEIDELAAELLVANKELIFQNQEKEDRAAELLVANKELVFQSQEKEDRAAELLVANKELVFQSQEKIKRAAELLTAKKEISTQADYIETQKSYYVEKQLLGKTLAYIGDAVISTDKWKNVVLLNKVAETLSGWTQQEAFGVSVDQVFNIVHERTRKKVDIVNIVMKSGVIHTLATNTILITKNGKELRIEDSAGPIFDEDNTIIGTVIVFRDYTEKWEQLKKIEYLSFHDELTGLYNRRYYEEELHRLNTINNLPLSLIMGDVNGLKLINDSFGHEVGDKLLKKAATIIRQGCRANDIVARLGGDEFIIILPKSNAEDTALLLEKIKALLKKERVDGLEISISFGFETKTEESQEIREVFKNTEDQMYRSKIYESASIRSETIDLITSTLFAKNGRELIHSKKVSELCVALSEKMGLSKDEINLMRLAGLMHDIGKIGISDEILNKTGSLNDDEYAEIKKHPEIGYRILSSVNEYSEISDYVLQHQEKWDGTGYPQGLKGEEIKMEARIIAIADSYDAMTTQRTYRDALSREEAMHEIRRCAGTQFDPWIAEMFLAMSPL